MRSPFLRRPRPKAQEPHHKETRLRKAAALLLTKRCPRRGTMRGTLEVKAVHVMSRGQGDHQRTTEACPVTDAHDAKTWSGSGDMHGWGLVDGKTQIVDIHDQMKCLYRTVSIKYHYSIDAYFSFGDVLGPLTVVGSPTTVNTPLSSHLSLCARDDGKL